jgi:hypothetical protein
MDGRGQVGKAFEQRVGRSVEVLVGDTEDLTIADGAEILPAALLDDTGQGNAVTCAAPGEDKDVWVGCSDGFCCSVSSRSTDERAPGCRDEFGDPGLGLDEGLAPLFAIDGEPRERFRAGSRFFERFVEVLDEDFGFRFCVSEGGKKANVGQDGGYVAGCEHQDGDRRLEDGGKRLHTVGNGRDNEIRVGGGDLGCVGGPGVVQDGEIAVGEFREGVKAVFGDGAEMVGASEGVESEGDGRLKRGDAHAGVILCGGEFAICSLMIVSMQRRLSANGLRLEVNARSVARGESFAHEMTFGTAPSVIYSGDGGVHGNFLAAAYRRICADAEWSKRLGKSYTASARVPRAADRWRGELECASSSDALLMNLFCYPRVLCRPGVCSLLGVEAGLKPEFGARARIAMRRDEVDRTELDMRLGNLMVEAKLTEGGFGTASRQRMMRYCAVDAVFDVEELPWLGDVVHGYQLVRGVLAAVQEDARFMVLCDGRRADMTEMWFRVLRAVRSYELRSRMALLSWQELAGVMPAAVREFLAEKYGIVAA